VAPTPGPTIPSSRPELEEARIAAALMGMDLTFGVGRASPGAAHRRRGGVHEWEVGASDFSLRVSRAYPACCK